MSRIWSFCKKCEMYHIDFGKSDLDKNYETHLSEKEKEEAISFPIYRTQLRAMPGVYLVCAVREYVEQAALQYPTGFFEPRLEKL